jgi:CheY-like chemotaxis protein
MLKFVIEGSGYKVVTARNAGEALERMRQSACDLVLVNYRMLKMIGSDPILAIKRWCSYRPDFWLCRFATPGIEARGRSCRQRRDPRHLAGQNASTRCST